MTETSSRPVITATTAEVRAWLDTAPAEALADLSVAELVGRMREALDRPAEG
jgi:hypothetical protein